MKKSHDHQEIGFFQIFIFLLSIYVIVSLLIESFFTLDPQVRILLEKIDVLVCGAFLIDFGWRFSRAPSKKAFMKWGWIDLLSSIPAWNGLLWGRLFRLFRILRMIRAFRSFNSLLAHLFADFPRGTLFSVAIATVFLTIFSTVSILSLERDAPGSNIRTAGDALWWTMTTVTTVGYGDKYPVSPEGRAVAVVLMIGGVGLFSTCTALIASKFAGMREVAQLDRIEKQLEELKKRLPEENKA